MTLSERYREMTQTSPPLPWRPVPIHIGGVTAVGFGMDTEWLLVLTHSGLGVVDCKSGLVVAREVEMESVFDESHPIYANGIGPLEGQRVPLAGLWGGGLRTMSRDGWVVHRVSPNWPAECGVLCPPEYPEIEDHSTAFMLVKDMNPPILALGFSDSGKTPVVANTLLYLWNR